MTLWPEWPFGQRHFGQRDTLVRVTLWPEWHFGQSDTLARVTLWSEWHFGQFFLLPLGYQRHTKSFWNIIIQWTSHDDLTEKLVLPKPPQSKFDGSSFFSQITKCSFNFFHLLYQFLFYFLQIKLFSPWMASIGHNLEQFWFVCWDNV
jgi:hypothetical protein